MLTISALASGALPASLRAQTAVLEGQVVDAISRVGVSGVEIRIQDSPHSSVTDSLGRFRLDGVAEGRLTLRTRHVSYGERAVEVVVAAAGTTSVRLELSTTAVVLAPLDVAALSAAERQLRGIGYRRNVVTRAQLAQVRGTNLTFADVLRQMVPGVRVRTTAGVVGAATCIELRGAPSGNRCLSPAVYLDGVPITNVATIFSAFPLEMIESIEVVPAAEAGGRFGTGALYGALLIESRRPGAAAARPELAGGSPFHDWSAEPGGHATLRSFAAAAAGNGAGLASGVAIATSCIGTRAPAHDRLVSSCDGWATIGASAAAIALPALGGALGSSLGGRSPDSRGRVLPAAVGAAMAIIPGYALLLTGQRLDSDPLRGAGMAALVVGAPFLSAMADHQFRRVRGSGRDLPD